MNALSHFRFRPRMTLIVFIGLVAGHAIFFYVAREAGMPHGAVPGGIVLAVAGLIVAKHVGLFAALLRSLHSLFRRRFRSEKPER